MEIPPIEDRTSIFNALAAVVHRLAENTIDTRRAGQMIYGLQVALRALEPPPAHRCPTAARAAKPQPESAPAQPAANNEQPTTSPSEESPAAPKTIAITKESLTYFLRSRHCYNCNAELFPPEELTFRRNAGAKPEVIEEARPALPAGPATDDPQPATVLPTLDAVALDLGPETSNLEPSTSTLADGPSVVSGEPSPHATFRTCFALHSPRRSVSLTCACVTGDSCVIRLGPGPKS